MKKNYKLISIIIVLILILLLCISISNNKEIKTIKSEKELLNIYNNQTNNSLSFIEKALLLPFSVFFDDYYSPVYEQWDDITTYNDAETTKGSSSSKDYSKTNIQVEGVDEADILKTDGDYIYSISNNEVLITNVKDPKDIKVVSRLKENLPQDLLLYKDKLIVISTTTTSRYRYYYSANNTIVTIYDISNKKEPKQIKTFTLNSQYHTTRCIDGNLYVFANGYLRKKEKKIDRSYEEDKETKEIKLNNIKYLDNNKSNHQTLIAEVDLNKISDIRLNSYLIDISNAYVSKDNIYLLNRGYYNSDRIKISSLFTLKGVIGFIKDLNNDTYEERTQIYKFKINKNKGVELKETNQVRGSIINQYSLDEKDGNLRMALQTSRGSRIAILDKKLNLLGETSELAEEERMYASRFMDNKAYLVTYRNTDPLFVIDLSNPKKPKVLGELKIPGYSTYLHPYDDNHLIGIGMDTREVVNRDSSGKVISTWTRTVGMKMALFDVSDVSNPKEIDKTTIGDEYTASAVLSNPKALLFSKEKNLIAIPVNDYKEKFQVRSSSLYEDEINNYIKNDNYIAEGYIVYDINLKGFKQKGIITHEKTSKEDDLRYFGRLLRGLYIEDNLYTVSEDYIKVNKLKDLEEISSLKVNKEGEI